MRVFILKREMSYTHIHTHLLYRLHLQILKCFPFNCAYCDLCNVCEMRYANIYDLKSELLQMKQKKAAIIIIIKINCKIA